MQIDLPYGKKNLRIDVPDKNLLKVVRPNEITPSEKSEDIIKDALGKPMGTDRLCEIAAPGDRVAIVVDDYTRPCPNEKLLLPVLSELKDAGVDDSDILIIVATGTHTPPSYEKIKEIVGDKVSRNYTVVSNDAREGDFVSVGVSKHGNEFFVMRDYVDSDIKIILSDIEYHYFAGYGGTRKSILPGISSFDSIQNNHSMLFEDSSNTGILRGNHLSEEMNEALRMAGCDFALSVVQNSKHEIVGAWAGTPEQVMDSGVKLVDSMYKQEVEVCPDIVVVSASGHPHDINVYQAMKALYTGTQIVREKGVVVFVAECPEGVGSDLYIDWLSRYDTADKIQKALKEKFVIGAHKAYYHRCAVEKYNVIFVTSMDKVCAEKDFEFKCANSPNDALTKAFDIVGSDAKVLVIPQGTTTHVVNMSSC